MPRPAVLDIRQAVADKYNIPLIEMVSNRQKRMYTRPRQIAMYLTRELTVLSLPQIGRQFGGRDHTTVMHAIRQVENLMRSDPELAATVRELQHLLEHPNPQ